MQVRRTAMKKLAIILAVAALSGCATQYPGPANYGSRAYAQAPDADGWQVVSVTPVPTGTGAQASASGDAGRVTTSEVVTYNPAPPSTVYATQPVYVPAPVYAPAPVYDPFWYPPISIGLGFSWSNWGHRGGGYHGGYHGGNRGGGRGHR
jgi:hypothetical protein